MVNVIDLALMTTQIKKNIVLTIIPIEESVKLAKYNNSETPKNVALRSKIQDECSKQTMINNKQLQRYFVINKNTKKIFLTNDIELSTNIKRDELGNHFIYDNNTWNSNIMYVIYLIQDLKKNYSIVRNLPNAFEYNFIKKIIPFCEKLPMLGNTISDFCKLLSALLSKNNLPGNMDTQMEEFVVSILNIFLTELIKEENIRFNNNTGKLEIVLERESLITLYKLLIETKFKPEFDSSKKIDKEIIDNNVLILSYVFYKIFSMPDLKKIIDKCHVVNSNQKLSLQMQGFELNIKEYANKTIGNTPLTIGHVINVVNSQL